MKNKSVIFFTVLMCTVNIHAQGLYGKIGGNMAFGWPWRYSSNESYHELIVSTTGTEVTSKNSNFGFGAGPSASVGYMFNSSIGTEIAVGSHFGISRINENTYLNPQTYRTYRTDVGIKCSWLWINPQIVVASNSSDFSPYARVGVVIGILPKMEMLYQNINDQGERKIEYIGGTPWGLNATLGISQKLKNNINLFGELEMVQLNFSPLSSEITKYLDENGNDILPSLNQKNRKTEFVDSWNSTDLTIDMPNKMAKINIPLSSVKVNVGIRYNF